MERSSNRRRETAGCDVVDPIVADERDVPLLQEIRDIGVIAGTAH
jgi:hypothetical protein